jgi:hypothetical protein
MVHRLKGSIKVVCKIIFQFCQVVPEIEANNKRYEEEQENMTKAVEDSYLKAKSEKSFLLHVLEIRLARLRELAPTRLHALEAFLRTDGRLSVQYC